MTIENSDEIKAYGGFTLGKIYVLKEGWKSKPGTYTSDFFKVLHEDDSPVLVLKFFKTVLGKDTTYSMKFLLCKNHQVYTHRFAVFNWRKMFDELT